jgi:hypothetical protein
MKRFIAACAQIVAAPNAVTENLEKAETWLEVVCQGRQTML